MDEHLDTFNAADEALADMRQEVVDDINYEIQERLDDHEQDSNS